MKKLTSEDIRIKSQDEQVKEAILEKYQSIDEFANAIGLYPISVKKYLRDKKLGTHKFKIKLVYALNKSLDEIVLDEKKQISKLVYTISENAKFYSEKNDTLLFQKLKKMCLKNRMIKEIIEIDRIYAMHHFHNKEVCKAIDFITLAIKEASIENITDAIVYYNTDLALFHFYEKEYEKAKLVLDAIKNEVSKCIRERTTFRYHFTYGVIYNHTSNYDKAIICFTNASKYAPNILEKGRTTMSIGLAYYRSGQYEEAMKYYLETMQLYSGVKEKQAIVYNNIAELYRIQGQYEEAMKNIDFALEFADKNNSMDYFIFAKTKAEIRIDMGETQKALDEIYHLIDSVDNIFIARKYILEGIKTIVELATINKNIEILRATEKKIIDIIKIGEGNDSFIDELKKTLGDIMIAYYKNFERR